VAAGVPPLEELLEPLEEVLLLAPDEDELLDELLPLEEELLELLEDELLPVLDAATPLDEELLLEEELPLLDGAGSPVPPQAVRIARLSSSADSRKSANKLCRSQAARYLAVEHLSMRVDALNLEWGGNVAPPSG
jgi:hypothetical protein